MIGDKRVMEWRTNDWVGRILWRFRKCLSLALALKGVEEKKEEGIRMREGIDSVQ